MQQLARGEQKVVYKRKKINFSPGQIFSYLVLFAWSLSTIYAMFWIVNNSFKVSRDVMNSSFKIAFDPVMVNYTTAFDRINIGKGYLNSLIMSGGTVLLVLLFGGLAAYVLSRFTFRGKKNIVLHPLRKLAYSGIRNSSSSLRIADQDVFGQHVFRPDVPSDGGQPDFRHPCPGWVHGHDPEGA